MSLFDRLLPTTVTNEYSGHPLAKYVFFAITIVSFLRSLIHIFAPDGGAMSIAGMDVTGEGGQNLVLLYGLWGLSQLLFACFFILVAIRYRSLIPLSYIFIFIEYFGRWLLGVFKPGIVAHTPPGAIGNYFLIPLALIMLILALRSPKSGITPN